MIEEVVRLSNGTTLSAPELGMILESIRRADGSGGASWTHTTWEGPITFSGPLPRVVWRNRGKEPTDFNVTRVLHVSERAKALIESFEPGVHQFERVEFEDGQGHRLPDRYLLFVTTILDIIDPASPGMILKGAFWTPMRNLIWDVKLGVMLPESEWPVGYDPNVKPQIFYRADAVQGHHLWRPKNSSGRFVSDELALAIKEAGLTGIRTRPSKTLADLQSQ